MPRLALLAACLLGLAATALAQDDPAPRFAGPIEGGYRLPNGWTITPAGRQVELTDLVLNIVPLPDGRHALAASSGFNDHRLALVDLVEGKVVASEEARQSWFGLTADAEGRRVWWSGGGGDRIYTFERDGTSLRSTIVPPPGEEIPNVPPSGNTFRSGLHLTPDGRTLYSLDIDAGTIERRLVGDASPAAPATIGGRPYDVALDRAGRRLYVSDWAGARLLVLEPESLRVVDRIPVGEHPNQIAVHPKDDRLFVACASSNSVAVVDTRRGVVVESIATSLFPRAPEGSTPDALAVSPDGATLYVANADNNCVAVVDISKPAQSQVKGFIPTGWYPTAVAVTPDGKSLLVGVGKGNQTRPNPPDEAFVAKIRDAIAAGKLPEDWKPWITRYPYIGTTLSGALSIVPVPDDEALAAHTERVYQNCPYSDALLTDAPHPEPTAIPTKVGDPSPIKHAIYIIKENRTYDQVFGDIEQGNGDPALCLFGRDVTPNHHKLAEEFVLLDNLYCNGHVSADGHPWSTMAYNTDYIARNWALTYSGREGVDDDDEGDLANAPSGYIWDACARAGLTYRSYGEYGARVSQPDGSARMEGRVPGLIGHVAPRFGLPVREGQTEVRDTDRVAAFLDELKEFEATGEMPHLIIMSLGEDHTFGTAPGRPTPAACVASNDLALGRLVEGVSRSRFWPETAIFVIEDDAQNGPDHVDAHRTVGLVVSPYTKRHHLDGTQYQTVSLLRTMELILGLPPLSQFDAAATPMFASFRAEPDLAPYAAEPARIDLDARNDATAFMAAVSAKMDWSEYDRINDFVLNEILWRSIKGPDAPLPPAVRRAIAYRPAARPAK